MPRPPQSTKRVTELDGLRGIAILAVMLFHYAPLSGPLHIADREMLAGWVGVDLFFVLSGYLIAGILLDTTGRPHYYRNFIVRRCLRIFPLYYASLAIYAFVKYYPASVDWKEYAHYGKYYFCYLGNFEVFLQNKWPTIVQMTPLWSLQIEEQFYLLFPLLVWALTRKSLARALLGAIAVAPLFRIALVIAMPKNIAGTYVLAPCRMDALALGALVAIVAREWPEKLNATWIRWTPLVCCIAGLPYMMIVDNTPWSTPMRTIGFSLIDLTFACVLARLVRPGRRAPSRFLQARPLVWIGTVSYGLYLLQIVAPQSLHFAIDRFSKIPPRGSLDLFVSFGAAMLAAWISWTFFESPILKLKRRFTSNRE